MASNPYGMIQRSIPALNAKVQQSYQPIFNDATAYRDALAGTEYGAAGRSLSSGLQGISGYLSRQGPLADSGARAALSARLAGSLYGGAASRVGQGYAGYLAQALAARRAYNYQLALLKAQRQAQQTGLGGVLGGVAGAFGGPFLGALGSYAGNRLFPGGGGGGYQASDAYYG